MQSQKLVKHAGSMSGAGAFKSAGETRQKCSGDSKNKPENARINRNVHEYLTHCLEHFDF